MPAVYSKTVPVARSVLTTPWLGENPPRKHVTGTSPAGAHVNTEHSSMPKQPEPRRKAGGHLLANTVRYQGQIASRKPNIAKLSQGWPKHALLVTAGVLGALPGAIWPQ